MVTSGVGQRRAQLAWPWGAGTRQGPPCSVQLHAAPCNVQPYRLVPVQRLAEGHARLGALRGGSRHVGAAGTWTRDVVVAGAAMRRSCDDVHYTCHRWYP